MQEALFYYGAYRDQLALENMSILLEYLTHGVINRTNSVNVLIQRIHAIHAEPEMKQALIILMSDIPSDDLPGLNVKNPDKPLSK